MIQRAYRLHVRIPEGKHHIILASSTLLLYRNNLFEVACRISLKKIIKFVSISAHANLIGHQIGNYGIKILRIQKGYRSYLIKKNIGLNNSN